jgi:beta-lactamase superfamily II metal-dependent hydrolase
MRRRLVSFLLSLVATASALAQAGAPLAQWAEGSLEIHQISTGRGNAALFILPDGTAMLVDAGAAGDGQPETDPHPDASRTPGDWIARYIARHLPVGITDLDYAVITHFHTDHIGQVRPISLMDHTGKYRLAGITEVAERIRIHTLLDRGWPDYAYPSPITDESTVNYRRFVNAQREAGMTVERFRPGSSSQIVLKHDAARYPTFAVRNIIANGEVWTGDGDATRNLFPPVSALLTADLPTENMCSLGLRLQYGSFRYFTGGDLPGAVDPGFPVWHSVEPAIASVIGPVDAHVVNQHGSMGEETEAFIKALQSTIVIVPSWLPSHPAPDVLKRIINSRFPPLKRYVFATDMRNSARIVIGQRATQLAAPPGHVVIRVEADGSQYRVFVLENQDERDIVVAAFGPFLAQSGIPIQ